MWLRQGEDYGLRITDYMPFRAGVPSTAPEKGCLKNPRILVRNDDFHFRGEEARAIYDDGSFTRFSVSSEAFTDPRTNVRGHVSSNTG